MDKQKFLECQSKNLNSKECGACPDRFRCHTIKARKFIVREIYSYVKEYEVHSESEEEALKTYLEGACMFDGSNNICKEDDIEIWEVNEWEE